MKCRVCRGPAIIDLRRHNANFCGEHFIKFCHDQVAKAIKDFSMCEPDDRLLVAVSGGKDSLAVWDMLTAMGYEADGLYIGLGIGEYSDVSGHYVRQFAEERQLRLIEIDLRDAYGYDVPTAAAVTKRVPCSACGLSKRHLFDAAAVDGGYDAVVTGHNLDDEAAVLYGNVMRWQTPYLARQRPVLAARKGFPRKIKPLVRLGEREMAAYCVIRGIDYQVEECPMAAGNKHLHYKEILNTQEAASPGSKAAFYFGFLRDAVDRFDDDPADHSLGTCERCGSPASSEVCSFCRLVERTEGAAPVPVDMPKVKAAGVPAATIDPTPSDPVLSDPTASDGVPT
ncbi:MAG: tRNA(Ile)-lysidine synthetase [Acidimicrobiales bacterium]